MSGSITGQPKKRGRPSTGGRDPHVGFRSPAEITAAIDAAASAEPDAPSRSEMIRRIVTDWLGTKGLLASDGRPAPEPQPTPQERARVARSDSKQVDRLMNEGGRARSRRAAGAQRAEELARVAV